MILFTESSRRLCHLLGPRPPHQGEEGKPTVAPPFGETPMLKVLLSPVTRAVTSPNSEHVVVMPLASQHPHHEAHMKVQQEVSRRHRAGLGHPPPPTSCTDQLPGHVYRHEHAETQFLQQLKQHAHAITRKMAPFFCLPTKLALTVFWNLGSDMWTSSGVVHYFF